MKKKTIVRQENGKLLVNTLPIDTDTGILHQVYYMDDLQFDDRFDVGFGYTESPPELSGQPIFVIEGEGNTEANVMNGMYMCMVRMCRVFAAFRYHNDLDYELYRQEVELYPSMIKLIRQYAEEYMSDTLFLGFSDTENIQAEEGVCPFKILWKAENDMFSLFILPRDNDKVDHDAKYDGVTMIDLGTDFKMTYGANPSLKESDGVFIMTIEFSKPKILLADAIWAIGKIVDHVLETIPAIVDDNEQARTYAGLVFTILSNNIAELVSVSEEEKENGEN